MYTVAKNALIVLSLLKQHGIRHIVINPGTTNVPLIQGIQNDPFFICYSIVDERSAIYFAIGLHLCTGERIATTCTSAQATRNYIPGLTEAFYKHVPILAITVSKHPKFDYQRYPQHPIQTSMPEDSVKKTFALPFISNSTDEMQCIRMVNDAILEITRRTPGPVQLNLPILDSELTIFTVAQLPDVRIIKRYMEWDKWAINLTDKKIMLVIGEHRPFSDEQISVIEAFLQSYNAFAYVNHLSNYHGKFSVPANILLNAVSDNLFKSTYKPDVLITIGGQTGDYPLLRKLSDGCESDFEHWHVSKRGDIIDTYDKLTRVFECPFELFFLRIAGKESTIHTYFETWEATYKSIQIPDDLPFSSAFFAQQLHKCIPQKSYMNFAILNSLRVWSLFQLDPSIICYSNVAAFGIDGCMSVLFGQSVTTDNLCFLIIGDLSFFYDMNSLGIRHLKNNIRILLVNNGCGQEFRMNLKLYDQMKDDIFPYIAAKGHFKNARGWAETCGFKYFSASTKEEFCQYKNDFISSSEQSIVFEVFTQPALEADSFFKHISERIRVESHIKSKLRSVLGDDGLKLAKRILRK